MRLVLHINDFSWPGARSGPTLAEIGSIADECGFDRIGVANHVWQHPIMGGPETDELECYSPLAFLAANAERVGLMAIVSGVRFRHPGVLAKTVSTPDVLSGGRAALGIGSGHYEEEARGLGIPFPQLRTRFEMLEETVQICPRMWSGERGDELPFEVRHYRLERPLNLAVRAGVCRARRTKEETMIHVIERDELPHGGTAHKFEGYRCGEVNVSFFLTDATPGTGPSLHKHPYAEVFVIQEGEVTFTVGDDTIVAAG